MPVKHIWISVIVSSALLLPAFSHALEATASSKGAESVMGASGQLEVLSAAVRAILQNELGRINSVLTCAKESKFWDGSACVSPIYSLTAPTVTTNPIALPVSWVDIGKKCTKKKFGVCTKHDRFCMSSCGQANRTDYTFDVTSNAVVVNAYSCPASTQINVGNGTCP